MQGRTGDTHAELVLAIRERSVFSKSNRGEKRARGETRRKTRRGGKSKEEARRGKKRREEGTLQQKCILGLKKAGL